MKSKPNVFLDELSDAKKDLLESVEEFNADFDDSSEVVDEGCKTLVIIRDLQHDRLAAKNNEISHRVAYTTRHIPYIYCIRLNTKCHMSWVYCQRFDSWRIAYSRIFKFLIFTEKIQCFWKTLTF